MAAVLSLGDRVVDLAAGVVTHPRGRSTLAPLEVALLRYLSDRAGEVVSRDDLQVDVWGISRTAQTRSIDVAVSRLRKKLEADPVNPRFLVTLHGSGYRLESVAPADAATRLPAEVDGFVGRTRELAALDEVLARHRLVTVLGPAGVGKTRLALEWARRAPLVLWCPLAAARDAGEAEGVLARALSVQLRPDEPGAPLAGALASRGPCVVLFDDAEGVHSALGERITALRGAAPQARFLVTSRFALGAPGEALVPLEPLPADTDGAALFELRARARHPGVELPSAEVAALVRDLDGLPLAIELAAARTGMLTLGEVAARLGDPGDPRASSGGRWDLLAGGASPRHATLRSALAATWSALGERHRSAMGALAAVDGTFDTRAAEAVLSPLVETSALDLLGELLGRSLLQRDRAAGRWSTLSSVRVFAREHTEPGALEAARVRLADHLAARYADAFARGTPSPEERAPLSADLGQLLGALGAAVARRDGPRAAALLGPTALASTRAGSLTLVVEQTAAVLALPLAPADQVVPALVRAQLATEGVWGEGRPSDHCATAAALAAAYAGPDLAVRAACGWGRALGREGEVARGEEVLRDAVAVAGRSGAPTTLGRALATLAWHHATDGGDTGRARELFGQALNHLVGRAGLQEAAYVHLGLARVATTERRHAEAAAELERARPALEEDGDAVRCVALRYNVANNLLQWCRAEEAAAAARAAVEAARRTGSARWLASGAGVLATALVAADRAAEVADLDLPGLAAAGVGPGPAANLWHREGLALLETGALDAARSALLTSRSLAPNDRYRLQAEVALACVEAAQGHAAQAMARLAHLRAATPPAPDVDRLLLGAEARVAFAAGDASAAAAALATCEARDLALGGALDAPLRRLRAALDGGPG